jgi:alkaline phosphatase D
MRGNKPSDLNRRQFAALAGAFGAVLATSGKASASARLWKERRDLYPEGVASGDPQHDSVVLWTRRPATDERAPKLTAEVSEDEAFTRVVAKTAVTPKADNDWTVRVLAAGLKPATTYWYRFTDAQGMGSRVGRTRTAPADGDERPVAFAFVSCQDQNTGWNNAYRRMIHEDMQKPEAEQLGFVLHLGDFVYEMVWYPEERTKGYLGRQIRDVVRYPKGEKHSDFHVPLDVGDYRALYRGYLADTDLQDARARWPFICMWDNHEFSWQGFQSLANFGKGVVNFQTRKVAATQAWFEYQPARVKKVRGGDWNEYDAPKVVDAPVTTFDEYGLGQEPNNLAAIGGLTVYRQLRYGRNVDLILTDNRSYRSSHPLTDDATDPFSTPNFLGAVPLEAVEIWDAGRTYNGGKPPETIAFGGKELPNFCKDKPAASMLGKDQKGWFLERLRSSGATWKVWGNSVGSLDARLDMQNLPEKFGKWPGQGYGSWNAVDWAAYRSERGEILDFVKANGVTGLTSVCGDRHAAYAGVLSKSLPPESYEPVALEFIGASISSPGDGEGNEFREPDSDPLHMLLVRRPKDAPPQTMLNMSITHGVRASLAYDASGGDLKAALALSNPEVAPHLSFVDVGGHGYSVVRAAPDALETEFVGIERPAERATTEDGGPLLYRVVHRAQAWKPGETPALEQAVVEGRLPLSV